MFIFLALTQQHAPSPPPKKKIYKIILNSQQIYSTYIA